MAPKPVPATPPVAPRAPQVAKSTVIGVQAPVRSAAAPPPSPGASDSWDVAPSDEDRTAVNVKIASATMKAATPPKAPPSPTAPAVTPAGPPVSPVQTAPMPVLTAAAAAAAVAAATPQAPPAAPAPAPAPPAVAPAQVYGTQQMGVTAADVRLIVRAIVDEAVAPLAARLSALEKLAAAAAAAPRMAAPTTAAPVPTAGASGQYSSAMALTPQPARVVVATSAPPAPLLDVAAIERDVPLDIDMRGMDGRKRKRRAVILFVVALLIVFGGLFGMLAKSYAPPH